MTLAFFWIFLVLMALGVPIVFGLLLAPTFQAMIENHSAFFTLILQRLYNGIDSFPLLALPFFVLAGELMNRGGITERIVDLAKSMVGHFHGGLAQVNILSSLLFAGLSGSAVADTSALGATLIPAMEKNGYSRKFAAAITAASSVIGPIIPPSGIMILYAFIMGVSVGGLFAAGIVPGMIIGFGLMILTNVLAKRRGFPVGEKRASLKHFFLALRSSFFPLLTPMIMLGGILSGLFTPTEAAAIAAAYALILTIFFQKSLSRHDMVAVLTNTAVNSGVILFLVGGAVVFSAFVSLSGAAATLAQVMTSLTDNIYLLLFLMNILLLIVGMFLDAGPAILILGPVLAPVAISIGVDPLHFAVMMCINLTVGLASPPMGLVLFVSASLSGDRVEEIAWEMVPFLALEIGVIFLVTFFPFISLSVPNMLGFH